MKTGALNKRIALQAETRTPDGAGGYALTWTTVASLWANIQPVFGRETSAADRQESRVTHKITLRWQSAVTPTASMRVLYKTRAFNIRAVLNANEADRWMILLAEEGSAT